MSLVYEGAPLQMEAKLDFIARKDEERAAAAAAAPPAAAAKPAAAPASRKRRAEGEPEPADGEEGGEGGEGEGEAAAEEAEAEVEVPPYEPGCVLRFEYGADVAFAAAPSFGLVKDTFGGRQEGGVVYVDYEAVRALPGPRSPPCLPTAGARALLPVACLPSAESCCRCKGSERAGLSRAAIAACPAARPCPDPGRRAEPALPHSAPPLANRRARGPARCALPRRRTRRRRRRARPTAA